VCSWLTPDFDILSDCVQNQVPPAIADQPAAVNRVLVRGLAKKRSERYRNCVALVGVLAACVKSARRGEHLNLSVAMINSIDMSMVLISPGEFLMGSPESEEGRRDDEGPQRRVRITQAYYVGQ
jgi:formylglycine-generating enzyme required for sulfatase activity